MFLLGAGVAQAAVPQPKSEGKYFHGKGTKTAEDYEDTAGQSSYDYANKGFEVGPVHLRPSADYQFRWDDNVFLEESGQEKNDLINTLRGKLNAELPLNGGQHLLTAGGSIYREIFHRFDNQNHTDYSVNAGLKLNFVPFTLDIDDLHEQTESRANTEFTDRIQRDENAFHSLLEVPFSQFFLENEITNFWVDYGEITDQSFNHNLFTVYQRIGHDWTPAMQVLAELSYINIDYTEVGDRNGDGYQYMGGIRGNFTELIAYQAWLGVQHRIYDQEIRPDYNNLVFRGALQYDPTELSTWILKGDVSPEESTFDNQSYYTRSRAELTWNRQIHDRIYWNSHGMVSYNDYSRITVRRATSEEETRRDWVWEGGTGLEYRLPNDVVSVTLDYRYSGRESNLDGLDYGGNEISAGVRAAF